MVYILTYFNLRARGELSRLICVEGKLDWKDKPVENWPELKVQITHIFNCTNSHNSFLNSQRPLLVNCQVCFINI